MASNPARGWQANKKRTCAPLVVLGLCPKRKNHGVVDTDSIKEDVIVKPSGRIRNGFLYPPDGPGGVITWDPAQGRYKEYFSETFGWQSIETRGVVIVEMKEGGLDAIVPVGMCQVSSVNFEDSVVPGAVVKKGDPLGYFLFGGSDIVMLFSKDLRFTSM